MDLENGIRGLPVKETPVAVVDLETTGLYPSGDRIVEISVVRIDPGDSPKLVLDTLINPNRRVSATDIHGITDDDVKDAPSFGEIADTFREAVANCVIAAYNVYFEEKFLRAELKRTGTNVFPPHLCLMYMRPLLNCGKKCSLADACAECGIKLDEVHMSSADAIAASQLWLQYIDAFSIRQVKTFGDIAGLGSYKFLDSFSLRPFPSLAGEKPTTGVQLKSRRSPVSPEEKRERKEKEISAMSIYWDALTAVMSDLLVTRDEVDYLQRKRQELDLRPEEIRWMHSRFFSGILADMSDDMKIDYSEVKQLNMVAEALRELGWMPGDMGYL